MGIFNRHNRQPKPEILPGDSDLVKRLKKYGSRGITVVRSPEGASVRPEDVQYLVPAESSTNSTEAASDSFEKSALYKRLTEYGTRGITHIDGPEGAPVSEETAKYLRPAGS